jgi:Tfp pilus assembly protein PilX
MLHRIHRDERGQSLVIILSLITILFLLGSSLAVHASVALRATRTTAGQGNDFYAADAATELGIWWQRNGKAGNPPAQTINGITTSTTITTAGGGGGSCPASAPTPIWMTGFEGGSVPMTSSDYFTGTSGTATAGFSQTPDTGVVRTGNYSMKVVSTGSASVFTAQQNQGPGGIPFGQTNVFHWATYITSVPAADLVIAALVANGNRTLWIYYQQSTGTFSIAGNGNAGTWASRTVLAGTVSPVSAQWQTFDVKFQEYTNPLVADWYVNGVAQPQFSWATTGTTSETIAQFGQPISTSTAAFTAYYDDFMFSATPADFPLGDVRISPAKPNAMGTHNTPANFQNNDNSAIDASTPGRLDEIPMPPASNTDYIKQVTAGAATYIEIGFEDTTQTCLKGASMFFGLHAPATQADNVAIKAVSNGVTYTLWSGSIASTTIKYAQRVGSQNAGSPGVGPWTQAVINGMTARFGFSTDISPNPYLDAIVMEYAWLPVVAGPATVTIVGTGGGSTITTDYLDAGAGIPTLNNWATTK